MKPETMLQLDIRPIATSKRQVIYTRMPFLVKTTIQFDKFIHCYCGKRRDTIRRIYCYDESIKTQKKYPYITFREVPFNEDNPNMYNEKMLGNLFMKYYYANHLADLTTNDPNGEFIRRELSMFLCKWVREFDLPNLVVDYHSNEYLLVDFFNQLFKDWKNNPNILTPEKKLRLPIRYIFLDKTKIDWQRKTFILEPNKDKEKKGEIIVP